MGGHADTDGLIDVQIIARNAVVGVHHEGERTRQTLLQQQEEVPIHGPHILRHLAQTAAQHRVLGLLQRETFQPRNDLNRLLEFHAADERIERIGRNDGDAAIFQQIGHPIDIVMVRMVRIYF